MLGNVDKKLWAEAVRHEVYIQNCTYHTTIKEIPAILAGQDSDIMGYISSGLKFGDEVYTWQKPLKKNQKVSKHLQDRARRGIFVGMESPRIVRILSSDDTRKVYKARLEETRLVEVLEEPIDLLGPTPEATPMEPENEENNSVGQEYDDDREGPIPLVISDDNENPGNNEDRRHIQEKDIAENVTHVPRYMQNTRSSTARRAKLMAEALIRDNKHRFYLAAEDDDIELLLLTYKDVKDDKLWKEAMDKEIKELEDLDAWDVVDETEASRHRILPSVWAFALKRDGRHKARICAGGHRDEKMEVEDKYSPTSDFETLLLILAIVAAQRRKCRQLDVKNAYVASSLRRVVYMNMPRGYEIPGKVLRLKKALYGLPDSGKNWYEEISGSLIEHGLKQSTNPCVFYNDSIILLLYVDDMLVTSRRDSDIEDLISFLSGKYQIKSGPLNDFLGIQITHTKEGLFASQRKFVEDKLREYQLDHMNGKWTPIERQESLDYKDQADPVLNGTLLWAAITRPDISYAVSKASSGEADGKRILRYLKQTAEYGILFKYDDSITLSAYSDSDWASDPNTRKSRTGYVYLVGSTPISWFSKRQTVIALSSTEAEYIALSECIKRGIYLRNLLGELGFQ
jgi:hypothetical protein